MARYIGCSEVSGCFRVAILLGTVLSRKMVRKRVGKRSIVDSHSSNRGHLKYLDDTLLIWERKARARATIGKFADPKLMYDARLTAIFCDL